MFRTMLKVRIVTENLVLLCLSFLVKFQVDLSSTVGVIRFSIVSHPSRQSCYLASCSSMFVLLLVEAHCFGLVVRCLN